MEFILINAADRIVCVLTGDGVWLGARLRLAQKAREVGARRAVQELARPHAAEHARQRRLHVVENDGLPARVEVVDQRLDALHTPLHIIKCHISVCWSDDAPLVQRVTHPSSQLFIV